MNDSTRLRPTYMGAPTQTVIIEDGSDKGGLTVGQIVHVRRQPGKFRVMKVLGEVGNGRAYEITRIPGNRAYRRQKAHEDRTASRKET